MPDPRDLQLSSYDYRLPQERIAQAPAEPRHSARLLMVPQATQGLDEARHGTVWDLLEELQPGDLLVVNDTRVLKARLKVRRSGGGLSELLVLEPRGEGRWLCLARPAKRMRPGDVLSIDGTSISLTVLDEDAASGGRLVQFPTDCRDAETIERLLNQWGEVPLPPYIDRHDPDDADRYQTRYADRPGAVAAPTAGLHFSDELLAGLQRKGVDLARITLHVGLGTFRPVETEDLTQLELHSEWIEVSAAVVEAIQRCPGRVIAVGTTCVRALEGAAQQNGGVLQPLTGPVNLVIQPGYRFRVVQGLVTNFHLPKSSLLLLVSALIGREKLLRLYDEAIQKQYRFFSYGDAMWIPREAILQSAQLIP
ncbi:tRNA preQ1(34) S-adenosylmethionine ribosyltransferase-isomerase QueA [Synechococcus sp. A15-28]|uniref:tRNA preQ1(34) S-adenosylmethionine ribosyltransferase-isomerase QueA n=1 Tax=Synechococcus sp. A15-28 TaxID=1050638 RepID=UPI001644C8C7|nr:tRNA preQ1(34) S-adenosylmethionine ribosyltransferase-isomerase QueA [Synechococcus sp. A15-28]QNI41723.1 S-adenosylmethionine:tRNA ribosyltransferase-isomerase [Synechococcus sp. A15-28]